jgi:hypothetical protein
MLYVGFRWEKKGTAADKPSQLGIHWMGNGLAHRVLSRVDDAQPG